MKLLSKKCQTCSDLLKVAWLKEVITSFILRIHHLIRTDLRIMHSNMQMRNSSCKNLMNRQIIFLDDQQAKYVSSWRIWRCKTYYLSCNFTYWNLSKRLDQFLIINVNIMMITIEVMHASMLINLTSLKSKVSWITTSWCSDCKTAKTS